MHYEQYWGLNLAPFENVPDPRFYVAASKHEEGLHRLLYGVEARKGAVLLTGDIGCGKTTLSRLVLRHLAQDRYETALIANPSFDPQDFLGEVLYQLGTKLEGSKLDRLHRLNEHLLENMKQDKDTVLIVDEAQTIKDDMIFEELRLLLNYQMNDRFLLTIILLGQPELNDRIDALPQFSQRVGIRFHLPAFTFEETTHYIESRLRTAGADGRPIFSGEALSLIFKSTGGIPRNINTVSDLCLLSGFLEKKVQIEGSLVSRVVADFRLGGLSSAAH
ncbi:MAG TPA: AAA family ATPase [Nitrospiraceae bacterium]|jgi:general secretion pathway protein A|nr:AAA family ATPase [Nitrospiraceae bacterium]